MNKVTGAAASILSLLAATSVSAQERARPFYEGKTITIYVGYAAGGTYDAYARLIASHLPRLIEGAPTAIVQNMPGASTVRATNYVYNVAPQDGTAIGAVASNVALEPMTQPGAVQYDVRKINWLPSPAGSNNLLVVWHGAQVRTFSDLAQREIKLAGLSPQSSAAIAAAVYSKALGARLKSIYGYQGLGDAILAMQRGEADGFATVPFDALSRQYRDDWKAGRLVVLAQSSERREPELGDVPSMLDLAKSEEDRRLVKMATVGAKMTFSYVMGPNVPVERVELMRAKFDQLYKDALFLKDAEKLKLSVEPVSAAEVTHNINEVYSMPADLTARFKAMIEAPQ